MFRRFTSVVFRFAGLAVLAASLAAPAVGAVGATPAGYDDLLTLFREWRAFEAPRLVNGVPDYSAAAMARQHTELATYRQRLEAARQHHRLG